MMMFGHTHIYKWHCGWPGWGVSRWTRAHFGARVVGIERLGRVPLEGRMGGLLEIKSGTNQLT